MRAVLAIFVLTLSMQAWALPPDAAQLNNEREMLQVMFQHLRSPVNSSACDLKPRFGSLRVADMILSHTLWSVQAQRDGVEKKPGLRCAEAQDARGFRDCYLTSAESIRIPGEPEGWSRTLFFKYHKEKKLILAKSFKCVDVP